MNVGRKLQILSSWLKRNKHTKEAQEVEELSEWEEPWHEEAVQEFGGEPMKEEEYYASRIPTFENLGTKPGRIDVPEEVFAKIMQKEGFQPVETGAGKPYVGGGALGKVFRGVYDGKPAVAKVVVSGIHTWSQEDEAGNWKRILRAKEMMPAELIKHIPNVYYAEDGEIDRKLIKEDFYRDYVDDQNSPIEYSIVIMEELKPLSKELRDAFKGRKMEESYSMLFKDEETINKMAADIYNRVIKNFNNTFNYTINVSDNISQKELEKIDQAMIFRFLYKTIVPGKIDETAKKLAMKIMSIGIKDEIQKDDEKLVRLVERLEPEISRMISISMDRYLGRTYGVPERWSYYDKTTPGLRQEDYFDAITRKLPEIANFVKTLETLAKEHGVGWADLHYNNVMMGEDGNLKIIDVGLYDRISEDQREEMMQ